ncbi:hypothetical protein RKD26_000745 [Streptomyces calvus]|uniref:hypothetical protein n=1 Tax=Streptomyces calvus TaxID=67282 RepID=UPI0035110F75
MKRRVVVLQAVEQPGPRLRFVEALLVALESNARVLVRLSTLEPARPHGTSVALPSSTTTSPSWKPAIQIARDEDGSVVVFPALPA